MNILELESLSKQFGNLTAVDSIDLKIEEGEIRGLIGPNGSGKTTMFNLISGFLPPSAGKVVFKGEDITGLSPEGIVKRGLARTFQLTTLFKEMTVLQNVVLGYHLHTGTGVFQQLFRTRAERDKEKMVEEKAIALLQDVGLANKKDKMAGELPLGDQRSLQTAIALATGPELLLLDEPASGLNPVETASAMGQIKELRDRGITILLVEHDMKAVMNTCEKISVLNFGRKIAEGIPEEVSKDKAVIEAYLGAA